MIKSVVTRKKLSCANQKTTISASEFEGYVDDQSRGMINYG
jgi:hypothetical protein